MSQAPTVTWLAVRELWMTFRLLLVLFGWVAAGALVGLVPGPPAVALSRLAIGMALATMLSGVVAAWSIAAERTAGRAGWLVTRSVARGTYLIGWYAALTVVSLTGLVLAGSLGWLSVAGGLGPNAGLAFAASTLAVAATTAASVALGTLFGALLRARAAVVLTLVACASTAVGAWLAAGTVAWLPGGAHLALARVGAAAVVPDALRAAGIGLALAGVLLVLARVALERTEL